MIAVPFTRCLALVAALLSSACHHAGASAGEPWLPPGQDMCPSGGGVDDGPGKGVELDAPQCLPVVSANCGGGFQGCTAGTPLGDGWYAVPLQGSSEVLRSRVRSWCPDNHCYNVFSTKEVDCDGCLDGKVPDPTCGFQEGRCMSHQHPGMKPR